MSNSHNSVCCNFSSWQYRSCVSFFFQQVSSACFTRRPKTTQKKPFNHTLKSNVCIFLLLLLLPLTKLLSSLCILSHQMYYLICICGYFLHKFALRWCLEKEIDPCVCVFCYICFSLTQYYLVRNVNIPGKTKTKTFSDRRYKYLALTKNPQRKKRRMLRVSVTCQNE